MGDKCKRRSLWSKARVTYYLHRGVSRMRFVCFRCGQRLRLGEPVLRLGMNHTSWRFVHDTCYESMYVDVSD